MIWRRWGLKSDPYFLDPIDEVTLDQFVGRTNAVFALHDVPEAQSVIFLETRRGLGSTSLGNFWRFGLVQKRICFTPLAEFRPDSRQSFLEFSASLIDGLNWSIREKYLFLSKDQQFLEHEEKSRRFFAAVSAQTGSENENRYLEKEAKDLLGEIENIVLKLGYETGILIQISIGYLEYECNREYFYEFRRKLEQVLLLDGYRWLFIVPVHLERFLCSGNGLPAARTARMKLEPLEPLEIQELLHRRKERLALNPHARLPVTSEVMEYLYTACRGSLTEILSSAKKLAESLSGYQTLEIDLPTAKPLIAELLQEEMRQKGFSPLSFEVMKYLVRQDQATSGTIAASLQKRRPNISKVLKLLCQAGLLRMEVHGRNRIYYPLPEVKLAFNNEAPRMG